MEGKTQMNSGGVFLDRDGVINVERVDYVKTISEFQFIEGALEAIVLLTRHNIPTVVLTNQSAVGRGIISKKRLKSIHLYMIRTLEKAGGKVAGVFYCPHTPEDMCNCRKPSIGLFTQASDALGLSLRNSWYIGDKLTDLRAGQMAGCRTILVPTNSPGALLRSVQEIDREIRRLRQRTRKIAGVARMVI